MEKQSIRVLIADDHGAFRAGLKLLLSQQRNISVVAEARNGQELVKYATELSPDIIITDIVMPVMDGITAARELARRKQPGKMIVMSAHGREEPILQMLEAGALGYILKTADHEELEEAISAVLQHKPYFCREITEMLTEIVSRNYQSPQKLAIYFTEREKDIIRLICRECTSKEIAHRLHLSKRTVEGHRTRIIDKIGAKSIAGVIKYAVEKGLD